MNPEAAKAPATSSLSPYFTGRRRRQVDKGRRSGPALAAAAIAALGFLLIGNGVYIHVKALLAQVLLDRAFTETVATGAAVKGWSWADTWPVAKVAVPRIGASAIVLQGSSGEALAFGPGHLTQSAQPGEPGTAVYAAHRDTHFAFLRDVRPGDAVMVTRADGTEFAYEITGSEVVHWDRSGITDDRSEARLALVTCWPLDGAMRGPLRYVVHARLVDRQVSRTPSAPPKAIAPS